MELFLVFILLFSLYGVAYGFVASKRDKRKIWVPPKPQPKLPFGLGPPETPLTPSDYKATTYMDHEVELIKNEVMAMVMSLGITLVMSLKFNVHISLLMQSVLTPMNTIDSVVLKKYLLGIKSDKPYRELLHAPDDTTFTEESPLFKKGEPRVEELPDETKEGDKTKSEAKNSSSSSSSKKKKTTATPASELD
jgi:hypothetical protein